MLISRIHLKGFKQFEVFTLHCKERNILVGPNNAGKSTTLDALRVVSDVIRFARRNRPERVSHPEDGVCATYRIPDSLISIPLDSVNRNYSDEAAKIEVRAENGNILRVSLDSVDGCSAYLVTERKMPETSAAFRAAFPIELIIAPTLGPFEREERYLADDTVRSSENTRLAHRHFRNILFRKTDDEFNAFATLVSETWPGVTIKRPRSKSVPAYLSMFYEERRIPKEVHWSGFGFQVWLQMLLQVSRGSESSILVLDEPDIYLHPDLQRRLVGIVAKRFKQYFIATHSTEIINEASAGDVVSVNSTFRSGKRIGSDEDYRDLFRYIGSSENAQFSRVARAKRVVFFEGQDARLLRKLSDRLTDTKLLSDPDTLILQAGGFGQWQRIVTTGWTLNKLFGMDAKIVALFDRDYRCSEEVDQFLVEVNGAGVLCRVLERKEIENYFLEPACLIAAVAKRAAERGQSVTEQEALAIVDACLEALKVDTSSQLMASRVAFAAKSGKGLAPATVMKLAMQDFEAAWTKRENRLALVPGKEFISMLSGKLQAEFGCSLTYTQIANELGRGGFSKELEAILREFDRHLGS